MAADIGGVPSTHINHLTPRVLDIDELYRRMQARGITMIDRIQGPPGWDGPDVLLRQTSFRALAEPRRFREPDGTITIGELRVRFGEVEQRGVALTPRGRDRYDEAVAEVGRQDDIAAEVWKRRSPQPRSSSPGRTSRSTPSASPTAPGTGDAPPRTWRHSSTRGRWSPSRSSTRTSSPLPPPGSSRRT